MKHMYKKQNKTGMGLKTMTSLWVMALTFITHLVSAQGMNGAYTINQLQPASATNFISFNALATALTTSGVAGPVTVNVVTNSGPYNEQVTFPVINGMNASNKVTINGNNNLITFNSTNSMMPWTILMNGADYFTFNNLQVQGQGATYAICLAITGGADYNTFSACTFSAPANGTSSYQIPVMWSSLSYAPSTGANSGNYDEFYNCQMFSGYYGIMNYGLTSAPFQQGNKLIGCTISDFYYYGNYWYYQANSVISGCTVNRPTRTTLTTAFYGMMIYYNQGSLIEKNIIEKPFDTQPTIFGTAYCWYWYAPLSLSPPMTKNVYRNNIVRNIKTNGTVYGAYAYYASGDIHHNTFSFDDATATAGTVYGLYFGGTTTYLNIDVRNNNISITKGGTGTKYGMYVPAMYNGITINNNNIYVNSLGGGNNHGYLSTLGTAANFAQWQGFGVDVQGANQNPNFVNLNTDLHPTNNAMDNLGAPLGVVFDQLNAVRNPSTPDMGALEFNIPACAGTPSANTIAGLSFSLCPGEPANLAIANLNNIYPSGLNLQWSSSTISGVGPWTPVNGATSFSYAAPGATTTTYFQVAVTCTNGGGNTMATATMNIAGTTTNTAPYFDGFETIGLNGRLPNCSWLASSAKTYTSAQTGNRLPRTGSSFATFEAGATNTYYTNGIYLNAGVNYSASVWYQSDFTGATNWSDLSVMVGTAQTIASQSLIASTNGPAVSPIYKSLSGTFSVSTSGMYYVGVKAVGASGAATYLSIDDLRITIPCNDPVNAPALVVGAGASTNVCQGAQVNLVASGANTYSWNTGGTTAAIVVTPNIAGLINYNVIGTNTLSGCAQNVNITLNVKPAPIINAFCIPANVCPGKSANLQASGNGVAAYLWNTGASGAILAVTPSASAVYTVQGTSSNGCLGSQTVAVNVNPTPTITGSASRNQMCLNESVSLSATGGVSYIWSSNNSALVLQGSPANAVAAVTGPASYTVTGTDANGCTGTAIVNVNVEACTGIKAMELGQGLQVYPNPTSGVFALRSQAKVFTAELMDMTGRVIATTEAKDEAVQFNLGGFAAGVYFVKVSSAEGINIVKVVKQ